MLLSCPNEFERRKAQIKSVTFSVFRAWLQEINKIMSYKQRDLTSG